MQVRNHAQRIRGAIEVSQPGRIPCSAQTARTVTGIAATNCPPAPLPVKKAASSFSPPIGTVPGTGWRMDAPS